MTDKIQTTHAPGEGIAAAQAPGAIVPAGPATETAGQALAAQAKALVEARFAVALRFPRDLDVVREKVLKECRRPYFAASARYAKPVGGKKVTGPSIRFVEGALRHFGNVPVDVQTVFDDPDRRIVRVSVADLETNVAYSQDVTIAKRVERRFLKDGQVAVRSRTNSTGQTTYLVEATDDEILNLQNALISKALRNLGLRILPGWIVDEAMDVVQKTARDEAAKDPDAERRRLFDAFSDVGIDVEALKDFLGHDGATLQPKEMEELRSVYVAIRDGEASWRDVMALREKVSKTEGEVAAAKADKKKSAALVEAAAKAAAAAKEAEAKAASADPKPASETQAPAGGSQPPLPIR